jgi:hypothetical protein
MNIRKEEEEKAQCFVAFVEEKYQDIKLSLPTEALELQIL